MQTRACVMMLMAVTQRERQQACRILGTGRLGARVASIAGKLHRSCGSGGCSLGTRRSTTQWHQQGKAAAHLHTAVIGSKTVVHGSCWQQAQRGLMTATRCMTLSREPGVASYLRKGVEAQSLCAPYLAPFPSSPPLATWLSLASLLTNALCVPPVLLIPLRALLRALATRSRTLPGTARCSTSWRPPLPTVPRWCGT